jgi:hypothetical protein
LQRAFSEFPGRVKSEKITSAEPPAKSVGSFAGVFLS